MRLTRQNVPLRNQMSLTNRDLNFIHRKNRSSGINTYIRFVIKLYRFNIAWLTVNLPHVTNLILAQAVAYLWREMCLIYRPPEPFFYIYIYM